MGLKHLRVGLLSGCFVLIAIVASGQSSTAQSGLEGRVLDETRLVLPGVTVTITSPALLVPQLVSTSDEEGRYRFAGLPAGVYAATFELAGFGSLRREELRLGVNAVMVLDVTLGLGDLTESIVVTGESPVVDIRTTTVATQMTTEILDTLPTSRSINEIVKLTPGTRMNVARVDVGGSTTGSTPGFKSYGSGASGFSLRLDGLETGEVFRYFDLGGVSEIEIRSIGKDPEFRSGGSQVYAVMKSGGNTFRGSAGVEYQNESLQSHNIDDRLRGLGVSVGNAMKNYYDSDVNIGGPIVRDRIWFHAGGHWQGRSNYLTGYSAEPGPNGVFGDADDVAGEEPLDIINYATKVTSQVSAQHRLEGFYNYNNKITWEQGAGTFRPRPSTSEYRLPSNTYKVEWTFTTGRSLVNVLVGQTKWNLSYGTYTDDRTSFDNVTRYWSGAAFTATDHAPPSTSANGNVQLRTGYAYIVGRHDLKVGGDLEFRDRDRKSNLRGPGTGGTGNDLVQYYNNGVPFEVYMWNTPTNAPVDTRDQGVYARDNWRLSDRLTLNLGIRWNRSYTEYPEQSGRAAATWCGDPTFAARPEAATRFCTDIDYPANKVYDWKITTPRLGLSYALTSDNRTALKVTYGRYGFERSGRDNEAFNKNTFGGLIFRWNDLNGDNRYDHPEEAGTFVRATGGTSRAENPDLKQPVADDFSVHVERELSSGLMGRVGYVYKREARLFQETNALRPFSAYSIPIAAIDPGADGSVGTSDDGGVVTYYDYDPAFAGSAFERQMNVNTEGYTDRFHNFEFVVDKRFSERWQALAYVLATRKSVWIDGIPQTPNLKFPKDETWEQQVTLSGSYIAPWGIQVAGVFEHRSGEALARDVQFRAGLRQLSLVTMRVEPVGAQRLPGVSLLNLRLERPLRFPGGRRLDLKLDFYNLLNANTVLAQSVRSGATFGRPTSIVPPRVVRLGARLSF